MSHNDTPEPLTALLAIALFVPLVAGVFTSCDAFKKKSNNVVVEQQAPPVTPTPTPTPTPGPSPAPSPYPGPLQNQWLSLNSTNPPAARAGHSAIWTGSRMIIWGGVGNTGALADGATLDPITGTWTTIAIGPTARFGHSAAWNGNRMVIWGGTNGTTFYNDGYAFDPVLNAWSPLSSEDTPGLSPAPRSGHTWVFTGSSFLMWGGASNSAPNGHIDGGHYLLNSFWSLLTSNPPAQILARIAHTAVWTGTRMIMFGGQNNGITSQDGFLFDPNTNVFTTIPVQPNTPANRSGHSAVWTGTQMLVWGGLLQGITTSYYNDGRIYDFASGAWFVMNTAPASLTARAGHSAVWAGDAMIIWGGTTSVAPMYRNDGAVWH